MKSFIILFLAVSFFSVDSFVQTQFDGWYRLKTMFQGENKCLEGNLCVYNFSNGKQGGFVWGSMKYGFRNAKLVMQDDGNLVVYDGNNQAKRSDPKVLFCLPFFKLS